MGEPTPISVGRELDRLPEIVVGWAKRHGPAGYGRVDALVIVGDLADHGLSPVVRPVGGIRDPHGASLRPLHPQGVAEDRGREAGDLGVPVGAGVLGIASLGH